MKITFTVDDDDARGIHEAISYAQTMPLFRETLPDFEGDLGGAILAEICRGWTDWMRSPRP